MTKWITRNCPVPLNSDLIYTRDVLKEYPELPGLSDVIYEFMINLMENGFVKISERSLRQGGNCYYWYFERLQKSI